ncbi:uroporphyrinogen-III synthase [Citricoccus sp. SGAir0253]|nr:uroporphyrinogen-III synthase [Citricoccus sp. SGAir0253]
MLTRQPAQAGALEAGLRAAGHEVRFLPLTDFELPEDPAPLREAVRRLAAGGYAWLVVTSPNTVRALVRAGWDGRLPAGVRVAVTGPGTARVLASAGGPAAPWMPDGDASAAGIIAAFPAPDLAGTGRPGRRVLLPQSALAPDEVAAALDARGWAVERIEAYRTVPYPAAPARRLLADGGHPVGLEEGPDGAVGLGALDGAAVVLTSPSAVRELVRRLGGRPVGDAAFIAIGRPTQRAAASCGLALAGTAASPDAPGVLAVLAGLPATH